MQYVIHTAGFVDDVMIRPAARQRRRRQGVYTYSKWFIRYNIAGEVWHLRLCAVCNTRQSPGASRRRPRRIIRQWSVSLFAALWENVISSTKPKVHNILHCRQTRTEPCTARSNTYRRFREVWTCGFWDMRANRQTDNQTRSSQYFAPSRGRST